MLTTKRPTPTTVLYTVSSRPTATTLSSRIRLTLSLLLRLSAAFLVVTILLFEYTHLTIAALDFHILQSLATHVLTSQPGCLILPILETSPRPYRLLFVAVTAYLILRRFHITESLLVIRGLGVQTSTSPPSYVGTARTRFIPTSSIQDIFIHEAFEGFEVRFYLSIVVEGEEDVVVVFPVSTYPLGCPV